MDAFSRIVLGYHGCDPTFAEDLLLGRVAVADWHMSQNPYDWLGHGIYFWEFAPYRARDWDAKGGVIGAIIQLGVCLDFTEVRNTALLQREFKMVRGMMRGTDQAMPRNKGKRRDLDCFMVNALVSTAARNNVHYQTIRCPFLEGRRVFPGSGIFHQSHIQVAVRDRRAIVGVFRPNL